MFPEAGLVRIASFFSSLLFPPRLNSHQMSVLASRYRLVESCNSGQTRFYDDGIHNEHDPIKHNFLGRLWFSSILEFRRRCEFGWRGAGEWATVVTMIFWRKPGIVEALVWLHVLDVQEGSSRQVDGGAGMDAHPVRCRGRRAKSAR